MKYMYTVIETPVFTAENITTTIDDEMFTNFPAEIGNPNYDQFLIDTGLTDKQVHALTPHVWYELDNGVS